MFQNMFKLVDKTYDIESIQEKTYGYLEIRKLTHKALKFSPPPRSYVL